MNEFIIKTRDEIKNGEKITYLNEGQKVTKNEMGILGKLARGEITLTGNEGYTFANIADQAGHYAFDVQQLYKDPNHDFSHDPIIRDYILAAKRYNSTRLAGTEAMPENVQDLVNFAISPEEQQTIQTRRAKQYAGEDRTDTTSEKTSTKETKKPIVVPIPSEEPSLVLEQDLKDIDDTTEKNKEKNIPKDADGMSYISAHGEITTNLHSHEQQPGETNGQYWDRVSTEYADLYTQKVGNVVIAPTTVKEIEALMTDKPTIIYLSRGGAQTRCGGCKEYGRYFMEYADQPEYSHMQFVSVDLNYPEIDAYFSSLNQLGLPQVACYKNNELIAHEDYMKDNIFRDQKSFMHGYTQLLDEISIS